MRVTLYSTFFAVCCLWGLAHASNEYDDIIREAAIRHGVPFALIKSVIRAESSFNSSAQSTLSNGDPGAQGLMQLMPATAAGLGVMDSFDPRDNIMGGSKYLAQMLAAHGNNPVLALAAYNAGPGNVQRYGGVPPFEETVNYITRISGFLSDYGAGSLSLAGLPTSFVSSPGGGGTFMAALESLPALNDVLDKFKDAVGVSPAAMKAGITAALLTIMFVWVAWHVVFLVGAIRDGSMPLQSGFFYAVRALVLLTVVVFFMSG